MQLSDRGLELLKFFEGLRTQAYQDEAGIWTIGWGTTRGVHKGMVVTEAEAEAMFRNDVADAVEEVNSRIHVKLTQNQFDASVSLFYNAGIPPTFIRLLNARKYKAAAEQFGRWIYVTNKVTGKKKKSAGLITRRLSEKLLFLEPDRQVVTEHVA